MAKIPLVGPSYEMRSLQFDAQRSINLYPVQDQEGKEVSALYGRPGLAVVSNLSSVAGRGCFASSNGTGFFVFGSIVYSISSDLSTINILGTLATSAGNVSMDENPFQLAICDGQFVYIYTYATTIFAQVTDPDLPMAGTITFLDSYFIVNQVDTGKFYISAPNDGTSWDALDFATAESSPDDLHRVISAVGQLWLLGSKTTEVWTDTGASTFPFQKIAGAKLNVGILAPHTAVELDNSLFWIGQDAIGQGIVYRAKGFAAQRISTEAIEMLLQKATDPANFKAWTYQQEGHAFYCITLGGMQTTLVYDVTTQLWHERAFMNTSGEFEQELPHSAMFLGNSQIAISRKTGTLYQMSQDFYTDGGFAICAERVYTHISDENKRLKFKQLEIAMQTGIEQDGTDADSTPIEDDLNPQISLQISRDGGRTYGNEYWTSFGRVGKYKKRAVWRRLGTAFDWTFKIRITDVVQRILIGSYLE